MPGASLSRERVGARGCCDILNADTAAVEQGDLVWRGPAWFPSGDEIAELFEQAFGCEAVSDEIAQRLLDGVVLCFETGTRQFGRQCCRKGCEYPCFWAANGQACLPLSCAMLG